MAVVVTIVTIFIVGFVVLDRIWPGAVKKFEEATIAILLATITLVTFIQVVARYGFGGGWTGSLEFTRLLFAWLIMFGASYAVSINSHLGVDAFMRMLPARPMRLLAVFGALAGLLYAVILIYSDWLQLFGIDAKGGALDYLGKMYKAGVGLEDLRFPAWIYEPLGIKDRVPRWAAYIILPIGLALFAYRCLEAAIDIMRGKREMIIASHEVEAMVADHKHAAEG